MRTRWHLAKKAVNLAFPSLRRCRKTLLQLRLGGFYRTTRIRHHESDQLLDPRACCHGGSKTNRFVGASLCTRTSALHFLPRADDEGTVRLDIRTEDAEDGGTVFEVGQLNPTRLDSRRSGHPAFWAHTGRAALSVE